MTATEYLQSLAKPTQVPKEIVPEGGPGRHDSPTERSPTPTSRVCAGSVER